MGSTLRDNSKIGLGPHAKSDVLDSAGASARTDESHHCHILKFILGRCYQHFTVFRNDCRYIGLTQAAEYADLLICEIDRLWDNPPELSNATWQLKRTVEELHD